MNLFIDSLADLLRNDRVFAWAFILTASLTLGAFALLIDLGLGKLAQLVKGSRV